MLRKEARLDGRDEGHQAEHGALLVALARIVAVLQQAVDDAPDAKRGLDHRRREVPGAVKGFPCLLCNHFWYV